jgi:lipid-A-disaccharide synthase
VGHPAVAQPTATEEEKRAFRNTFGLGEAPILLLRPPASERTLRRLLPIWREVLRRVAAARPELRVAVPDARADLKAQVADWPGRPVLLVSRHDALAQALRRAALGAAQAALVAELEESLWLAPNRVPLAVATEPGWSGLAARPRGPAPLDLVAGTRAVPVFRGPACRPDAVAGALLSLMAAPGAQHQAMAVAMERLGAGGEAPAVRAARAILADG